MRGINSALKALKKCFQCQHSSKIPGELFPRCHAPKKVQEECILHEECMREAYLLEWEKEERKCAESYLK